MGGRGADSGVSGQSGIGQVIIQKRSEPNKHGYAYYMTGKRDVITNWDEEGNYHKNGIKIKEDVRQRFNTLDEAIKYAKKNKYKYLSL
nr:MAG TPA: Putative oxidoreductase [Caudoviricetes sp.]